MSGLRPAWDRTERWLARPWAGAALLLALAVVYGWAYWHDPLNPGSAPAAERTGWWSWSDQYKYLLEAQQLAEGRITPEVYHYPLGYAALAAPFVRWLPTHPFFVPNLLLVLASAALWWRLARRWLPATVALVVATGFVVVHAGVLRLTMIVPWNTLPTQAAFLAGIVLILETRGPRAAWWLSAVAAVTWLVKPIDAACLAPLLVWSVLRLPAWRSRFLCGAGGMALIACAVLAVGLLNRAIHGDWRTPYERMIPVMVGFFSYPMPEKLFWTFIDARPFFGETDTALLWRYPWLFLAAPGLVFWVKREGAAGAACVATLGLSWLAYLGYNDFFPSSFFRYTLIHYVAWSFLPLGAAVAGACWGGWKLKAAGGAWLATLVLVLAALGLQLEERALPVAAAPGEIAVLPAVRPLWVHYQNEPLEKVTALRLDGRTMLEAADYQIPYVPSDLKLLLGSRALGTRLSAAPEAGISAVPRAGVYQWGWRWEWGRLAGRR